MDITININFSCSEEELNRVLEILSLLKEKKPTTRFPVGPGAGYFPQSYEDDS